MTAAVVGKTVESTKGVARGVSEGVEDGRKAGESVDSAVIVTDAAELTEHGGVVVYAVNESGGGAEVVLAFENKAEVPMRISGLEVMGMDDEGFALKPAAAASGSLTIPLKSRSKISYQFSVAPAKIKQVRVWDLSLSTPGAAP